MSHSSSHLQKGQVFQWRLKQQHLPCEFLFHAKKLGCLKTRYPKIPGFMILQILIMFPLKHASQMEVAAAKSQNQGRLLQHCVKKSKSCRLKKDRNYCTSKQDICTSWCAFFLSEPASKDRILQPPIGFHPTRPRLLTRLICVRLDEQVQLLAHGSKLLLQPAQKSWDSTQEL